MRQTIPKDREIYKNRKIHKNHKIYQTHKTVFCAGIILILLILGIAGSLFVYRHSSGRCVAHIYQNGELIRTIDLNDVTENISFEITGENGASNTIEVHPGEIGIVAASCPDKVCVNMGFIRNDRLPITCLPNKLVIEIESGSAEENEIDGLSR